eukprot:TRINITY_DN4722_c0_g2_i5.p9 TRINITY_DN4722_c0_g2~~TRINITY_DN4722_c0_g2_i5.p9  ORF type:complete len:156 (-),score=8.88 TRINITY_DN4722_c0_g2_i5:571-1038(-)
MNECSRAGVMQNSRTFFVPQQLQPRMSLTASRQGTTLCTFCACICQRCSRIYPYYIFMIVNTVKHGISQGKVCRKQYWFLLEQVEVFKVGWLEILLAWILSLGFILNLAQGCMLGVGGCVWLGQFGQGQGYAFNATNFKEKMIKFYQMKFCQKRR